MKLADGRIMQISNAENIALANEISQKQEAYKLEITTYTKQLEDKLKLQTDNIEATKSLYDKFNQYLKDETRNTAGSMIESLSNVDKQLEQTLQLKVRAGMESLGTQPQTTT